MLMIDLYVGVNETAWNHHPVDAGPLVCISPVYGRSARTKRENLVEVPKSARVFEDSGAFCDGPGERLTLKMAFERQIKHAARHRYSHQLAGMASYDLLIDEKWIDGQRYKMRWSEVGAQAAVTETIGAAGYLDKNRHFLPSHIKLILSAQGVTPQQYLRCVQSIAPFFQRGDILGLGGWCILGKMPSLMVSFRETISLVVPLAAQFTRRIHIWGVCYAPALGELLWMCDQHGIKLSTDSSGPQLRPAYGEWGYMGWRDLDYVRPPVETRGLERARHVRATRGWLANFRQLEWYREPRIRKADQLCFSF